MRLVQEHGTTLIPIDSEHAALFQCLQNVAKTQVERLVIIGSGGPLWTLSAEQRRTVTREQVLTHPSDYDGVGIKEKSIKLQDDTRKRINEGLGELIKAHGNKKT